MIARTIFMILSATWLGEPVRWNHAVAFGFIVLGAWFVVRTF